MKSGFLGQKTNFKAGNPGSAFSESGHETGFLGEKKVERKKNEIGISGSDLRRETGFLGTNPKQKAERTKR